jgi:hypothetical protein
MKERYGVCFRIDQRCRCPGDFDMAHEASERKFIATPEKGEVSALLVRPEGASHLLVLGHGASTDMRHATLQTIAERLSDPGIATFRYNFRSSPEGRRASGPPRRRRR